MQTGVLFVFDNILFGGLLFLLSGYFLFLPANLQAVFTDNFGHGVAYFLGDERSFVFVSCRTEAFFKFGKGFFISKGIVEGNVPCCYSDGMACFLQVQQAGDIVVCLILNCFFGIQVGMELFKEVLGGGGQIESAGGYNGIYRTALVVGFFGNIQSLAVKQVDLGNCYVGRISQHFIDLQFGHFKFGIEKMLLYGIEVV